MSQKDHFELLATYNQWMNAKVYEAAAQLSEEELTKDRGAFFGSIAGTLNHILVADILWLKRFATQPPGLSSLSEVARLPNPSHLDQILFDDFSALSEQRAWLDGQIIRWVRELVEADLNRILSYRTIEGVDASKRLSSLVLHFFNHQTHHRGQVSTLLSQAGLDVGVTDLVALVPEETSV